MTRERDELNCKTVEMVKEEKRPQENIVDKVVSGSLLGNYFLLRI